MKYWLYLGGEVPGTYTPAELAALPGVVSATLVCPAEGKILEKNWRPCAEFPDIAAALKQRPPEKPRKPDAHADLSQFFDSSSQRIYQHVGDLMRELEKQRAEIAELKTQLKLARDAKPS